MQEEASCFSKVALASLTALGLLLKISHILPLRLEVSFKLWQLLVKLSMPMQTWFMCRVVYYNWRKREL